MPDPPVPVSAVITTPSYRVLTVTFDQPLRDVTITKPPWTIRWNDQNQEIIDNYVSGSTVWFHIQDVGADVGIDRVNYDDTLEEIQGASNAKPTVSFTDFPVT